ncbi:anhydro-N-acetylmuramic acid kinase [Agromyces sp. LHK192]|uniref:anhydro-N-acetylmuramic acid kinase n=1 Tax=Agromyces sp. LHK192 TaxID=2498704 RepID=UPI001F0C57F1|nr:anhydro-N-acetylmuramic acid kinase [Agromyces sp. LHK192]
MSLQSGTSADGIDVAVVDVDLDARASGDGVAAPAGLAFRITPVLLRTVDWDEPLRADILDAALGGAIDAGAWCRLDNRLGRAFAEAAAVVVAEASAGDPDAATTAANDSAPDLVVSHGQTVHHWVEGGRVHGTTQLGEPAWIAERLDAPVLSHLRAADIAAGGGGAPLMAVFDRLWLGEQARTAGRAIATVNLGGIANVQVVHPDGAVTAFDSGPGNALLDEAVARASGGERTYDDGGRIAAAGRVHEALLADLSAHPYFAAPAPKTTGRETFHLGVVDAAAARVGAEAITPADLLATLVELTARTVVDSLADGGAADAGAPADAAELIVSGGGALNPLLLGRIRDLAGAAGIRVVSSADRGIDPAFKESIMFALLGALSWHGVPVTIQGPEARIAGRLSPGPRGLALPEPLGPATLGTAAHGAAASVVVIPPPGTPADLEPVPASEGGTR